MAMQYSYTKLRKDFGRQPMFSVVCPHLLDTVSPDVKEQMKYILRNPVDQASQTVGSQIHHEVNTERIVLQETGINHIEGGWPKEVNYEDEEQTARYRRRIERDESYVEAVLQLAPKLKHYIDQNNAIDVYDLFFQNMRPEEPVEKFTVRINNIFKDPDNRPVSSIGWTCAEDTKLVVSYCDRTFPVRPNNHNVNSVGYTWNLEYPTSPADEFLPPVPCWQIVCSPIKPSIIYGGLEDGRVCIFDLRSGKTPNAFSPFHLAHRDPISALLFISSRLNNEFFSGATEGLCMWWDVRNLSQPVDIMIMSVFAPSISEFDLARAEPVSSLQFDKSFPTRFLCGTDTGLVINVNRKGKSHNEVMNSVFRAHNGPVKALHRNLSILKMFLTCGDWCVNVWSEEITSLPIIPGQLQKSRLNDATWAPQRASGYMSVSADGRFRYWDLLRKYHEPITNLKLSQHPLLKIKAHENGHLVAIGDNKGAMYLLSLSEVLVFSGDKDKQRMVQTYDRETRRERILETRVKEIRLKLKTEDVGTEAPPEEDVIMQDFSQVETEYKHIVDEEMRRTGVQQISLKRIDEVKQEIIRTR